MSILDVASHQLSENQNAFSWWLFKAGSIALSLGLAGGYLDTVFPVAPSDTSSMTAWADIMTQTLSWISPVSAWAGLAMLSLLWAREGGRLCSWVVLKGISVAKWTCSRFRRRQACQ